MKLTVGSSKQQSQESSMTSKVSWKKGAEVNSGRAHSTLKVDGVFLMKGAEGRKGGEGERKLKKNSRD